jgi:hypothetical protein
MTAYTGDFQARLDRDHAALGGHESALVVAVDPGPIPGVVMLCGADRSVFQCDPDSVLWLVQKMLTVNLLHSRRILAVERFVVGMRAARSATPKAGAVTRDMIGALTELGRSLPGVTVALRCAGEVMPWASDKRLKAAGLLEVTKGMPHARSAARHALFASVADCNLPDPLSTKVRAP